MPPFWSQMIHRVPQISLCSSLLGQSGNPDFFICATSSNGRRLTKLHGAIAGILHWTHRKEYRCSSGDETVYTPEPKFASVDAEHYMQGNHSGLCSAMSSFLSAYHKDAQALLSVDEPKTTWKMLPLNITISAYRFDALFQAKHDCLTELSNC